MLRVSIILALSLTAVKVKGEPNITQERLLEGPIAEKLLQEKVEVPIPAEQWTKAAKLWLARSCVGEAGFTSYDECLGIAWVYATRVKEVGIPLIPLILRYSAAVKGASSKKRPWIPNLRLDGKMPKGWPRRLSWKKHKVYWLRLLEVLDDWAHGHYANPVEGANHYGGPMDVPGRSWVRIYPEPRWLFRNSFYRNIKD